MKNFIIYYLLTSHLSLLAFPVSPLANSRLVLRNTKKITTIKKLSANLPPNSTGAREADKKGINMKINKMILLSLIGIMVLILGINCKKNPVIPPDKPTDCYYPQGNRSFTWEMDTVAWFPSTVAGVWAFSDSDAYVIGTITDGKPPYDQRIGRHWNGRIWEDNINGTYGYGQDISIIPRNDVTGDDHFMVAVGYGAPTGIISAGIAEFNNLTKKWKSYELQAAGELRSVWTDGKGYFIAVGDNGMIYTKDGYSAGWVYTKAPTDYNFFRVNGVSKNEIYILGYFSTIENVTYPQIWKYDNNNWIKLLDDLDTTNTYIKIPNNEHTIGDIYANRCSITDSLQLYVIGWESYLFKTKGNSLSFDGINLTFRGLLLRNMERTGLDINGFSPSDLWIFGTRYNFFHWNGINFQKIVLPGLPNDDAQFGDQRKMIKTKSGKVFLPSEVSSQVYSVVQGIQ